MNKVGIVGVGPIGMHFTKLLIKAKYNVTVFDLSKELVMAAVEQGAAAAGSPAEVTRQSDVVILTLPGNKAVKNVMEESNGVLGSLKEGQIVIDSGTSHPDLDAMYERLCAEKGVGFIDSPVTWRKQGLILMVGGSQSIFEKVEDIISCISYKYKYLGSIGRGQVLKSVNQMVFSNLSAIWAEAVEYSAKNDIHRDLLVDFLEMNVPERMFGDDFSRISGTIELNYKDLLYVMELAHEAGANIPMTNMVHEIFKFSVAKGEGKLDQNGIIKYWRTLNG
jgi:3-hydroxyisobutyrate dehydrogenase